MSDLIEPNPAIRTLLTNRSALKAYAIDERADQHFELVGASAAVWALLEAPVTRRALAAELADIFELEANVARRTVDEELAAFSSRGMLMEQQRHHRTADIQPSLNPRPFPRGPDP